MIPEDLTGPVFRPEDDGFAAEASGFNPAAAHRPSLIVAASRASDVAAAVRHAAASGLGVGVMATGHGGGAPVDGGMLINTRRMSGVSLDPEARTATVQAGTTWGEVVAAAAPYGLAGLNGSSPGVGVVGYTLGGGASLFSRTFGYAADLVHSLEVVTADGELRHVDQDTAPDLFWGLRGGKGALGVVTSMTFDLVPMPDLYAGGLFYAAEDAARVLAAYRAWTETVGDRTTSSVAILRIPEMPPMMHVRVIHLGETEEGETVAAPLRAAAPVIQDALGPLPYARIKEVYNDPEGPVPAYDRGVLLRDLPETTLERLLEVAGPGKDLPLIAVEIRHLGGAASRRAPDFNAVGGRDAAYSLAVVAPAIPGVPELVDRVMETGADSATGGVVNVLGSASDPERVRAGWPPEIYARLVELKRRYDPGDLFRYGHRLQG
ncbi:FAD-binding oxidoreductase [Streptosporangiaceae bacterium NEAU-GS5]|nr:FAD-binding oxidoreductase [Streptosporangiaceae bacterium NEAU-GS5]